MKCNENETIVARYMKIAFIKTFLIAMHILQSSVQYSETQRKNILMIFQMVQPSFV